MTNSCMSHFLVSLFLFVFLLLCATFPSVHGEPKTTGRRDDKTKIFDPRLPSARLTGPRPPGTLLLNMLIKNEAVHLDRTLPKWAKIIDYWIIGVDDANTDNSPDIIKKHLGHIPGEIVIVHFDGMGPTWTILVEHGIKHYPQATHGIIADADFMPMKDYLNKMELDIRCSKHMYTIWTEDHRNERKMDWIYRNIPGAAVRRRTHQTLEVPELDGQEVFQTLIDLPVEEREGGYQDRSGQKNLRYIGFLEADLIDYPNDTRTTYYLGYAHFDIFSAHKANPSADDWDHLKKSVDFFKQRADMEGNAEERWFAILKLGEIYERFYHNWAEAEKWYRICTERDAERADAFFYIGQHYRLVGDHKTAHNWLHTSATLKMPQRSLFQWHYLYLCLGKLEYVRNLLALGDQVDKAQIKEAIYLLKTADCRGGDPGNMGELKSQLETLTLKANTARAPSDEAVHIFHIKQLLKFLVKHLDTLEETLGNDAPISVSMDSQDQQEQEDEEQHSLFSELIQHLETLQNYTSGYKKLIASERPTYLTCRNYRRATTPYLRYITSNDDKIQQLVKKKKMLSKWTKLNLNVRAHCRTTY